MRSRVDEVESRRGRLFSKAGFSEEVAATSLTSASVGLCHGTERKLGIGRRGRWSWEQKRIEGRAQDCFWSEL